MEKGFIYIIDSNNNETYINIATISNVQKSSNHSDIWVINLTITDSIGVFTKIETRTPFEQIRERIDTAIREQYK